ncbi:MAG: diguanylate cyclase [Pseudomonadota bacterium]|nr:diguanylate cyclase [Pseudomonadota bacterium]
MKTSTNRFLHRCLWRFPQGLAAFVVTTALAMAGNSPTVSYRADPFLERVDALTTEGVEQPDRALAELKALQATHADSPAEQRALLLALGSVNALSGHAAVATDYAERLLAPQPDNDNAHAQAASNLIRAQIAETAGQLDVAAALAQAALPAWQAGCQSEGAASPRGETTCVYRPLWQVLQILERRALSQGLTVVANTHAQASLALAEWAGDARRRATNLGNLALYANGRGERELAQRLMAQSKHFAAQTDSGVERARITNLEARLALARGEYHAAVQNYEDALAQATFAHAPRLQATLLNNLSDVYTRMGRPADALHAAERSLVIARALKAGGLERILINNAGIAKIGLGRIAEGKRDLAQLLDLWAQSGETGRQQNTLLEFGKALADAGDARGALELYHRERKLNTELMQANRQSALKELQSRFDADARERDIELLARDNALKSAALTNQDLLQRIWWLLAFVMLMAITLVTILYRRVRDTRRRLEASHLQLQAQSERDPLTNLANRRYFQAVMSSLGGEAGFEGALLLVDIDHFKNVNDAYGHAAGDQVLVEVARRLNEAVRGVDLVVRWGGEEFLILAPRATAEQAEQVASRVLRVLGQTPIALTGTGPSAATSLRVTASIGYGRFPLPPYSAAVPWEQAVNLADMALYTAKNQGRNRAVGIVSSTASTAEALRDIEADFDRAWHEGRVTLAQRSGPPAPAEGALPMDAKRRAHA